MGAWEGLGAGRKGLVARHRLCMEHGTLEDRGEARARGCKRSGREGWSLATVYVWSTARGRRLLLMCSPGRTTLRTAPSPNSVCIT